METLMKKPALRYPESSYHYKHRESKRAKPMTFILGSRCIDGVVMVADRRFTENYGSSYLYDNKLIHHVEGIIVGFSGSRGIFELFMSGITQHVMESGGITLNPFVFKTSELLEKLNNRFHREENFDALIGIGNEPSSLRYFYPDGRMETVTTYKTIGSGTPYGSVFLKKLWHPEMNMEDVAELGYFIIKYIEMFELDLTVGVGDKGRPQIWFLPDGFAAPDKPRYSEPDEALFEKFETNTKIRLQRYQNSLVDDYRL
jgi:20S proteasome alpha/beta subunit